MSRLLTLVLLLGFSTKYATCLEDETFPVVTISNGPIMGTKFTSSWTNRTIYAFQGVPYAAPPVGDLRFKDPQLPSNWTDVLNCTRNDTAWCMQYAMFGDNPPSISEDCLFLNVYSPEMNVTSGSPWPVMVWVHGGWWLTGSGAQELYGPDKLVAEGVVVVTMNYRLGAFGFLSLNMSEAPGNVGLKDQVLALQWVQREIAKFGGDPNRVTIVGESAGSFSMHLLYLSPLATGLFHGVIGESGTSLVEAAIENGTFFAMSLAELLKCPTANASLALHCLMNTSADDILLYQGSVERSYEANLRGDGLVWRAVVDKDSSSQPFMPAMPLDLYQQGEGSFVPFIMGTNKNEGILHLESDAGMQNITDLVNLELLVPENVRSVCSLQQLKAKAEEINTFYFNGATPSFSTNITSYLNLYTDLMMAYPTAESARMFRTRGDVYLYNFVFDGSFRSAMADEYEQLYKTSFVMHAEELNYLFIIVNVTQTAAQDSPEVKTWRRMVRMWTNFVKYGSPTTWIADDVLGELSWLPIDNSSMRYLSIDTELTMMSSDYMGPNVALWDSISVLPSTGAQLQAISLLILIIPSQLYMLSYSS